MTAPTETTLSRRPSRVRGPDARGVRPRRSASPFRPGAGRQAHGGPVAYLLLGLMAVISLFPLYWTIVAASTSSQAVNRAAPPLLPGGRLISNLGAAWRDADLGKAVLNSFVVSGSVAASTALFATLAGYAFAKLRFRLRTALLLVVIATAAVPPQLSVIPLFQIMTSLGWYGRLPAVIAPTLVSAVGVFFMRQYLAEALPDELIEAARVDGAGSHRIFWHVVLPAARPGMLVLFLITFVQSWNDFFWPFVVLTSENPTVQVAMVKLAQGYVPDQSVIMAGALLGTLPLLLLFLVFGRRIVGNLTLGALKG
ncbi:MULTISPECIES: carbohydrate ABC transporter permease [Streptomyces]|uniref:Carbohydrate ABC transporter permease n=1 Tax=Streptomyces koelreuteriae TaxID=2838015 RepID=A0ABX8G1Z5_9ACTN|nr:MULTISPECIES: carbohydrate ABC transporter permease [Streptomyces]QWB27222.1 carbohydrate ABC transporter permease [Streptomyces koelreuteriae]UUA10306.1 carbohydrate ABC transporter permease [Streptomyces koelreuteriae]UUA17913.1 carbohydrate ABC transporter permease [Streptomyces sp. CRCS-T-1]